MATEPDDEALRWAGDTDPTLDAPVPGVRPAARNERAGTDDAVEDAVEAEPELADGWSRPVAPSQTAATLPAVAPTAGSFELVGMGVLAGIYFLYTIGWFISTSRVGNPITDPVGGFMFSLGAWLAVAAPVIWFGAAFWLTGGRPRARIAWLIAGVVLLVPLPVILGVGGVS